MRRSTCIALIAAAAWLGCLAAPSAANILHVRPGGSGDGSNWTKALGSVNEAAARARPGDQIWVAAGFYAGTHAWLGPGVSLYGGFSGKEGAFEQRDPKANVTILDGVSWDAVVGAYWTGEARHVIDGFTIQHGGCPVYCEGVTVTISNNHITENASGYDWGGPVLNTCSGSTVANNLIENNWGSIGAGGLIVVTSAGVQVRGNVIRGNSSGYGDQSSGYGGAIYVWRVTDFTLADNTIADNWGTFGGGLLSSESQVTLENNTITGNTATFLTGGMMAWGFGDFEARNNVVADNHTYIGAGGISAYDGTATIEGNAVTGNTSEGGGGIEVMRAPAGAGSVSVARNAVHGNTGGWVGGIWLQACSEISVTDNEVSGNTASGIGGIYAEQSAGVLSGNTVDNNAGGAVGGVYAYQSTVDVVSNRITGNTTPDWTGGLALNSCSSTVRWNHLSGNHGVIIGAMCVYYGYAGVTNNTFVDNVSDGWGGGMNIDGASVTVANNLFARNQANHGGAIDIAPYIQPWIINNTIVHNSSAYPYGGGIAIDGAWPLIVNNVIAYNTNGGIGNPWGSGAWLWNNCVYGNTSGDYLDLGPGWGDISADPQFVNDAAGVYMIRNTSPCVDAGISWFSDSSWTDLLGRGRVRGASVDIGAYEVQGQPK